MYENLCPKIWEIYEPNRCHATNFKTEAMNKNLNDLINDKFIVKGGNKLIGDIKIEGSKNAALPIMAATILSDSDIILHNVPTLLDTSVMISLLENHGASLTHTSNNDNNILKINTSNINYFVSPYEMVSRMRASFLILGPLLAKFGKAKISLPGGCNIGNRPVDLHLSALEQMGARISIEDGFVVASVNKKLQAAEINFPFISVGATENIMMAACLANGVTIINNAAREPEIIALAEFLIKMGARISGAGSSQIIIEGSDNLSSCEFRIPYDRITAATYAIAAAMTDGRINMLDLDLDIFSNLLEIFEKIGLVIEKSKDGVVAYKSKYGLNSAEIITGPYPEFPTDLQAQIIALLSLADGHSRVTEEIFENRFMHVPELNRIGCNIKLANRIALIEKAPRLFGANMVASDLRCSAALLLAALAAEGESIIEKIYYIDRGYEFIEEKLVKCGANIIRVSG